MEVIGVIEKILDPITGTGRNGEWKKQELIIKTSGEHSRQICLIAWGDTVQVDNLKAGDPIKAHINIESREWNGRWFTDVKVWRIEAQDEDRQAEPVPPPERESNGDKEFDDLPF